MLFMNGKDIISGALESFKKITKELDLGIRLSEEERKKTVKELDSKRRKFEKLAKEADAKVAGNVADIAQAQNVKENLEKLLSGKL